MHRFRVVALVSVFLFPACGVFRGVKQVLPFVGESSGAPDSLVPDVRHDVAVFKFDYRGQTRQVVIQLFPSQAPKTVANFQRLIRTDYYEGQAIHRVIPNYLVQAGDPSTHDDSSRDSWGLGGPDYTLPLEATLRHQLGSVGMARLPDRQNPGRRSNGSQFYIALGDLKNLDGTYTVFGRIIQGYSLLQDLSELPADDNDRPYLRVEIKTTKLGNSRQYTPEDPRQLQRVARRKSLEEVPAKSPGALSRIWHRIW